MVKVLTMCLFTAIQQVVVLCCVVGTVTATTQDATKEPRPWSWQCESGRCVKQSSAAGHGLVTLNTCKLTCGRAGVLWPLPTTSSVGDQVALFLPGNISYQPTCQNEVCYLLEEAFAIFKDNLQRYHPSYSNGDAPWTGPWNATTEAHMLYLDVTVTGVDSTLTLNTNESYELSVITTDALTTAVILAPTYFGARHALETLSQLVEYHETDDALMVVTQASVSDVPIFPYRGLLLDTSRNFISVKSLKRTIEGMAASKLNTLHWHITDTHSFPLVVDSVPNMNYYGAYSSSEVYTPDDIAVLKEYAQVRGVRLLPELDAPAHSGNGWQWGEGSGVGNLAVCVNQEPWQSYCVEPPCGQLNLANPNMYNVLGLIYEDLARLFSPMDLFHFGGDEINVNCWNSTEEILTWMMDNGYGVDAAAYYSQWAVFQEKARQLLVAAAGNEGIQGVIWTSELTDPERLESSLNSSQYIIQIWTEKNDPMIAELLTRGYRVIFSNYDAWYLDCGMGAWVGEGNNWCSPYKGWQTVYENSPYDIATGQTGSPHTDLILGGEAALWTEQADDATVDSKLWPRGAALAERLWSNPDTNWYAAENAFIHHRQRLVKRGIQAERIQPQWCHQNEGLCYL